MTVIMVLIYLFIGIFDQVFDPSLNAINGWGNGATNFAFATIFQPWNWSGTVSILGIEVSTLYLILGTAIAAAVGIAIAGYVVGRSDIVLLVVLFTSFISLGAPTCIVLYNFVSRNVGMFTNCTAGQPCGPALIFGALTAGILAIMWLFTCLEWWLWRPVTQ